MICINRRNQIIGLLIGVSSIAISGNALGDPPTRVARLGYIAGAVSYSPAGENDWVEAPMNRPLTTGDRLWADSGAQDELQIGSAAIRMRGNTSVTILNLDDRVAQLQLSQGTLNVRVRRLGPNDVFEIDTPNLALSLRQPGNYRIDVDADGNATTVAVRRGEAEVDGEGAAYMVEEAQSYRFAGVGLRDYQYQSLPPADEFERWAAERDRRIDNSASARYVSADMIGYEDLDDHGSWRSDSSYGNVWVPSHVAADWAPYHDGHWAWVDPWGWTWVDNEPWGFAVSHYGRWVNINSSWGWVPGPIATPVVYAPALVAFVGGSGFTVSISGGNVAGVAWFPLGPRDVYRPSYKVSLNYFAGINAGSTSVNRTNITNVYNNTNVTNITYANRNVPGAVIAVSATAFSQSQPVSKSAVKLTKDEIGKASVATMATAAPVAPVPVSLRGGAAPGHTPPAAALSRQVVVKTAPPAAPVPFVARQAAMAANPGRPLDSTALAKIKPASTAQAAPVKLAHPAAAVAPMSKAPPSAPTQSTMPAAGQVPPQNRQQHTEASTVPPPHQKPVEPPPAPETGLKQPENRSIVHPPEGLPKNAEGPVKPVPSAPKPRIEQFEAAPHPAKPESAPEHPMPQHEPRQAPPAVQKEASPHEPVAPEPPHAPANHPPTAAHPSAPTPQHEEAKPQPTKHEEQHAVKDEKKEEEKQHKE